MRGQVDEGIIKSIDSKGGGNENNNPGDNNNAGDDNNDDEEYAAVVITSDKLGNTEQRHARMSVQQIINEIPGTHPRDFVSLSLTSLGDANRKRRAMMMNHYSVKNTIHPWFILPRGSEIVVSFSFFFDSFVTIITSPDRDFVRPISFIVLCIVPTFLRPLFFPLRLLLLWC
jgi:hypothetical protein